MARQPAETPPEVIPAHRGLHGRAMLTAAGTAVRLDEPMAKSLSRSEAWQEEAWVYYDTLPELKFYGRFIRNSLSKAQLVPARVMPMGRPQPIDNPTTDEELAVAEAVNLLRGDAATTGNILGDIGLHLDFAGECVLVVWAETLPGELLPGAWQARIVPQDMIAEGKTRDGRRTRELLSSTDKTVPGITLDPDFSYVARLWSPHPRRWAEADSVVRGVLDIADELQILSRMIRATARSRIAGAGILLYPEEVAPPAKFGQVEASDPAQAAEDDPLLSDLMDVMTAAIRDEGTPAAVVPMLWRLPSRYIEMVRHLTFERPIDATAAGQRAELRQRLAQGLDVPAEVLLGMADVNHWTGWLIDDQTYQAHLEPKLIAACNALTSAYLVEYLRALDIPDPERFCFWFDPQSLTTNPNRGEDVKEAHNRNLVSDEFVRQSLGISEADAPSDDGLLRKMLLNRGLFTPEQTAALLERTGLIDSPLIVTQAATVDVVEPPPEPGAPNEIIATPDLETPGEEPPRPLTAAAKPETALSKRLAEIDQQLLGDLLALADAAVTRSLEMAGARVRRKVPHAGALARQIKDVPQDLVVHAIGLDALQTLGLEEEEVLAGTLSGIEPKVAAILTRAQRRTKAALASVDYDYDDEDERKAEDNNDAAVAAFLLGVGAVALRQLSGPTRGINDQILGEVDNTYRVDPGAVRGAMARAGGATGRMTADGQLVNAKDEVIATGVGTGPDVMEALVTVGLTHAGYSWVYGDPSSRRSNFEPHEELDGTVFANLSDPVLSNSFGFPPSPFFYPGDHRGCLCTYEPVIESDTTDDLLDGLEGEE